MSVTLSSRDLSQIQNALRVILSPFDFGGIDGWRVATRLAVTPLVNAHSALTFLSVAGALRAEGNRPFVFSDYVSRYVHFDPMPQFSTSHAMTWETIQMGWKPQVRDAWDGSEFNNDWVRPMALCQPSGLSVRVGPILPNFPVPRMCGVCGLWFYRDRELPNNDYHRELAILELLLPAFEASAHMLTAQINRLENLSAILGDFDSAVALYNDAGQCVHENRALQQITRNDAEAARVRLECARTARHIATMHVNRLRKSGTSSPEISARRDVRTAIGKYSVRGVLLGADISGPSPLVAVLLTREPVAGMPNSAMRERFSLTSREISVANLLASGNSNSEIALQLGITIHTVRRHVEHILAKLDVHTRGAAVARLRNV